VSHVGKKFLTGLAVTIGVLVVLAVALYEFGGMWPASGASQTAYAAEVAAGRQPAIESRFTIPIPGCVCHSDDPVLQMQHSNRRMSECKGCHGR